MSDTPETESLLIQFKTSIDNAQSQADSEIAILSAWEAAIEKMQLLERQRNAYAETLREIDKSGMVGNVIRNRHPELAKEKP